MSNLFYQQLQKESDGELIMKQFTEDMHVNIYIIKCHKSDKPIAYTATYDQAISIIKALELRNLIFDVYEKDFYEIVEK